MSGRSIGRERLASFTDAQLVMWLFIVEHMARIEEGIANLSASAQPGDRLFDPELTALQAEIRAELARRNAGKGGTSER